jgi:membrane associated rhomboid family serine protease
MGESNTSIFSSALVAFRLVFLMWLTFSFELLYHIDLGFLGIKPRSMTGLVGILTAPMIHGSLQHLLSNTIPLLFLGSVLFFFYEKIGSIVFFRCYFLTNVLVWIFSPRVSYHIGASGLIYGLASFLIFFGFLRGDLLSLVISIAIFLVYGGIFYGVLPSDPSVSWESHLAGATVGATTAFNLSNKKRIR